MLIPIWLGLGLSTLGALLLVVFGLVWPKPGSPLHDWGFRAGVGLMVVGFGLTIVGS